MIRPGTVITKSPHSGGMEIKMTLKLFVGAVGKFLLGAVLVGILIFLPAGSFYFFNGWLLMAVLFIPMFLA